MKDWKPSIYRTKTSRFIAVILPLGIVLFLFLNYAIPNDVKIRKYKKNQIDIKDDKELWKYKIHNIKHS